MNRDKVAVCRFVIGRARLKMDAWRRACMIRVTYSLTPMSKRISRKTFPSVSDIQIVRTVVGGATMYHA
jgi:hypothetical protein